MSGGGASPSSTPSSSRPLRESDLVHEHPAPGRWLVDLPGTKKLKTVCGLIVGEHALRVEAFVCRQPDENREQLWTFLLQHNARMYGVAYSIDSVGDVYLTGRLPHAAVTPEEIDRILGAVLSYADDHFNAMLEIGFGTSIRREWDWRVKRGESLRNLEAFAAFADPHAPRRGDRTAVRTPSPGYARRWWVLATMTVCLLVVIMGNTILNVALPTLQRELGATQGELQWAVDAYILVFAGLLFTWGVIGDRIGRRKVLLIGLTVFAVGSVFAAFSDSPIELIGWRAVMGIGGAAVQPTTLAVITNVFPPRERGRAIGVWAGTAGIAVAGGPLAGGAVLRALLVGLGLPHRRPGRRPRHRRRPRVRPRVEGPLPRAARRPRRPAVDRRAGRPGLRDHPRRLRRRLDDARRAGPAASAGCVLLALFVWLQRRSTHPALDVSPLPQPGLLRRGGRLGLNFFALLGATFYLVYYLQGVRGYSPLQSGAALIPVARRHGAHGAAQLRSGRAVRRQGGLRHRLPADRAVVRRRPAARPRRRRSGCCSSSCRCRGSAWAR